MSKSKQRREREAAEKIAKRKALEAEFGLKPGALKPTYPTAQRATSSAKGADYYRNRGTR